MVIEGQHRRRDRFGAKKTVTMSSLYRHRSVRWFGFRKRLSIFLGPAENREKHADLQKIISPTRAGVWGS